MKTFVRLIRRYVLAAVGIVLLLLFSGVAVLGWLGWLESCRLPQREYSSSEIADSMVETAEGLAFGAERWCWTMWETSAGATACRRS